MPIGWFVIEPPTQGGINVALKKTVISAFGGMMTTGSFSISLKKFSMALAGSALDGTIGITTSKIVMNFLGIHEVPGTFAFTLKKAQINFIQDLMSGSFALQHKKIQMALAGGQEIPGSIALVHKKIELNLAFQLASGVFAPVLKKTVLNFSGGQDIPGSIALQTKKTELNLAGFMVPDGAISIVKPKIVMAFAGDQNIPGSIAMTHKKTQLALVGTHEQAGSIGIGLKKININVISSVPVAFDVMGAGTSGFNGFVGTAGGTWNHTVTSGLTNVAMIMIFDVRYGGQTRAGQTTYTVTLGGVQMTLLGFAQVNSENSVEMWGALNVGTGVKAMSLSVGNTAAFTGREIIARSFSYANVGSFGTAVTNTGTGTSPTASFGSATPNDMVICGYGAAQQAITAATGGNSRVVNINSGDGYAQMAAADAIGASPTAFGGTVASSAAWGTVADRLIAA